MDQSGSDTEVISLVYVVHVEPKRFADEFDVGSGGEKESVIALRLLAQGTEGMKKPMTELQIS